MHMTARMRAVDPYGSITKTVSCKQQNHSMQAAELWKHASSRTMVAWKQQNHRSAELLKRKQQNHGNIQASELKHASSRTMVACKQQNYRSMQAAELWKHASSRTMDCSSIYRVHVHCTSCCNKNTSCLLKTCIDCINACSLRLTRQV